MIVGQIRHTTNILDDVVIVNFLDDILVLDFVDDVMVLNFFNNVFILNILINKCRDVDCVAPINPSPVA
jgi:hypothetical protein